jgi:hypothetical protein
MEFIFCGKNRSLQENLPLAGLNRLISVFTVLLFLNTICSGQIDLSDKISVNIEAGSLLNALQTISTKSGVRFAYRQSLLEQKQVSTKKYSCTLDDILADLLTPNDLCYTFQNKQIIIHTNCLPKHFTISGVVYDDSTMAPLPFVFVSIAGKNTGAVANQDGQFEMEAEYTKAKSEIVVFSSMGYQRDSLTIKPGSSEGLVVLLKTKSYPVPEVVVYLRDFFTEKLGNTRDRDAGSLYLDTHGQQTALYIKNRKKRPGNLVAVEYYLSNEGNTDAPLRIRIYEVDSAGKPGDDLIEDALVVKPRVNQGWYTINLEKLQLEIPENGIFIAVEGVFPGDFEKYYGESEFIDLAKAENNVNSTTLAYGQRIGYNRKCRKDTWHYSMSKVWFQLEKQSFGVMIAAVVKYEKINENEISGNDE